MRMKCDVRFFSYLVIAAIVLLEFTILLSPVKKRTSDDLVRPRHPKDVKTQQIVETKQPTEREKSFFFKDIEKRSDVSKKCRCVDCEVDKDCGGLWSGKVVGESSVFDPNHSFDKISFVIVVSYCNQDLSWFEDFTANIEPSQINNVAIYSNCGSSFLGTFPKKTIVTVNNVPTDILYLKGINDIYKKKDTSKEAIIFLSEKSEDSRSLLDILRIMNKTGFACGSEPKKGKSAYHASKALLQWRPLWSDNEMGTIMKDLKYSFPHKFTEVCGGSSFGATRSAIQEAPQEFWKNLDDTVSKHSSTRISTLRYSKVINKSWAGLLATPLAEYQSIALEKYGTGIDIEDGALIKEEDTAAICLFSNSPVSYTTEFVDYHLALGFDHIFIYKSTDISYERRKLKERDKVSVIYFPGEGDKLTAWNSCGTVIRKKQSYTWIAFLNDDEFVAIKDKERTVFDILRNVPLGAGGLALNQYTFDYNGEISHRPLPLLKRFQRRQSEVDDRVNLIVRTSCFKGKFVSVYSFEYDDEDLRSFDTNGKSLVPVPRIPVINPDGPVDKAVIYHFDTKSVEEYAMRCDQNKEEKRLKPPCQGNAAIIERWKDYDRLLGITYVVDDSGWEFLKSKIPAYALFDSEKIDQFATILNKLSNWK